MSVNILMARRVSVALAAVVAPFVLATSVVAGGTDAAPDSRLPAGPTGACDWVDQAAIADLPLIEAADLLSELTTFRAAIDTSGLAAELEGQGPYTVFAPSNTAMAEIPQNVWDSLLADQALLKSIVGQHIVAGQSLSGADLAAAGTVETQGRPVTVTADGETLQVDGNNVVCGDIQTADATIFVIDGVLEPADTGGCAPGSSVPGSSVPASSAPVMSTPGSSVPC